MDRAQQQQVISAVIEEYELPQNVETIEGPGRLGVWIEEVGRWLVIEVAGRRWWTNDRELITGAEGLGSIDLEEHEEEQ